MSELWVGTGRAYARISDAVNAARSGDVIYVEAGVYENDFASIGKDLKIVGVDGRAHLKASEAIGNGKGILVTNGDVTLENIEFSGARVADQNGAGVRYESGSLTLENCYFHDNENGLLAASNAAGRIEIVNSEFADNGRGDGQTHGVYVNEVASLTVTNSDFHDTNVGHHLKSRALATEVRDSKFDDGAGDSSFSIDLPNGGDAVVAGNTLIQGAAAGNKYMVHFGGETATPHPGTLLLEGNDFINYREAGATAVLNQTDRAVEIRGNDFVGVTKIVEGPATLSGNRLGLELSDLAEPLTPEPGGAPDETPLPQPEDQAPQPEFQFPQSDYLNAADFFAGSDWAGSNAGQRGAQLDAFAELRALAEQRAGETPTEFAFPDGISPRSGDGFPG